LESIYWVLCWACHRKCRHCYEPRFRPYVHGELARVVAQARDNAPKVLANLPDAMGFDEDAAEGVVRRPGRLIQAGGELLIDPVREAVLYPTLERVAARWPGQGVKAIVQTTGDLLTPRIIEDLLARGVWMISVAGMDDFHVGMEGDRRLPLIERLRAMFAAAGMRDGTGLDLARATLADGPCWSMFGATEDAWIGKLWPRGRAWENGLSKAGMEDNFCAAWSGGMNVLQVGRAGSEVSIDPDGAVYPCCLKTRAPLGWLTEERLEGRYERRLYAAPAGRAPLEVIRNYREALAAAGWTIAFECGGADCGRNEAMGRIIWSQDRRLDTGRPLPCRAQSRGDLDRNLRRAEQLQALPRDLRARHRPSRHRLPRRDGGADDRRGRHAHGARGHGQDRARQHPVRLRYRAACARQRADA